MEATGGLTIPAGGMGGSWIVKLPSARFAAVPENEYAMLALARAVGTGVLRQATYGGDVDEAVRRNLDDTGNNDLPCDCPVGDSALFNNAFASGPITGAEMKRHFLNDSPEPITKTISVEDLRAGNFTIAPRVLVVDDDATNLRRVAGWLVMAGYGVVEAHDGVEGLRIFHDDEKGFNLILSYWSMPNMMGTEMLRKIRRNSKQQKLMMMSTDPLTVRSELKKLRLNDVRVLDKVEFDPQQVEKAVKAAIEANDAGTADTD